MTRWVGGSVCADNSVYAANRNTPSFSEQLRKTDIVRTAELEINVAVQM